MPSIPLSKPQRDWRLPELSTRDRSVCLRQGAGVPPTLLSPRKAGGRVRQARPVGLRTSQLLGQVLPPPCPPPGSRGEGKKGAVRRRGLGPADNSSWVSDFLPSSEMSSNRARLENRANGPRSPARGGGMQSIFDWRLHGPRHPCQGIPGARWRNAIHFRVAGYMAPGTLAKASRRAVEECKDCPWLKLKC
jgi:hypothetical protein